MLVLYAYVNKAYSHTSIENLPKLPFNSRLAELRSTSDLGLNDDMLKELCKGVEIYLDELFRKADGIFNMYKVRQFFELSKVNIFDDDLSKTIRPRSESYFSGGKSYSSRKGIEHMSVVSDYFDPVNENIN